MAFIYEINGQRVEFEKEPSERDIDDAARSLRPAPQSQQQRPVEGAGGAAFGVYRPQGRRPESQQDREAAKDMPLQTARGVVTGMLGGPSDLLNLPGVLYGAATGQQSPYTVPYGSEQFNEMLPFKSDAPSAKLARLGGEVLAPFPSVKGLQAIPGAVRGAGDVVSGAVGTGTGYIARPGRAPRGYQVPSQRNPIGSTYTPPEELAKFERGELPYGQMPEQRPISELPQGRLDRAAMMLSGGNIPNAGQGARAFGERLGETYRNPLTAAADIGSMFFTGGVPVLTTLRGGLAGAQALADMRLANKGFTPELPNILKEYETGVRPLPGVQPGPMPRGFQAAGPISPGGLAQPTPAAQAAMATTQRVARTQPQSQPKPVAQPQPVQQPAPSLFEQPLDSVPQLKPKTSGYNSPDEMAAALVAQGISPYDIKQLVKRDFNVDVVVPEPIVKPKPVEVKPQPIDRSQIPKTAEELASEQAILDLINQRRGVVTGDPVANREKFISNIPEIRKQLEQGRAENKSMYADRITSANENARIVNTGFDSKSVFSDADVIRHQINQTTQGAVRQANNKISVSKNGYDELAETAGMTLDWNSAPNIRDMGLADARKTMSKWMFDQTDKNIPELGLKKRKESTTSIGKRHNAEIEAEMAKLPAEEKALMAANQNRPINNALQAALDKARANKGNAPPGVMKMITNEPAAIDKIKAAQWLTPEEFDNQVFMNTLGKDSGEEFIAKMKTPEGSIIKAIDKELNSEAIQYADGSGFLVRKYREVPGAEDYTIFNNDGSRYEISKFSDGIRKIEIKKGDNIVAEYIKSSNEKTGKWAVIDRNAEGGGQMIYKGDLKFSKNPNTRKLHKELPKIDFNSVVQEQLARAQDLKGK